jgi:hypothetical protein
MGNAVYRDLVQALVMVEVDWLCLAVPNSYESINGARAQISNDYENDHVQLARTVGLYRRARPLLH